MKPTPLQLAILTFALQPGADVRLFPTGTHAARDGRGPWTLTDAAGPAVAARMNDSAQKVEVVIDYEHQTLNAETNGLPAPAAGWANKFEYRPGDGLYALGVRWTGKAKEMIDADEYRYFSPVVAYGKDGSVRAIVQGALTNYPALDSLGELVQRAQLRFSPQDQTTEDSEMNELLAAIIAACKLPTTANEKDAVAALTKLKEQADTAAALTTANAALKANADKVPALETQIAALKAGEPDPAKYVPVGVVTELRNELAALTGKVNGGEVETIVQDALKAGKLSAAMADWARDLGKKDLAGLKSYVEKSPAIAALAHTQSGGKPPAPAGDDGLTDAERNVCAKAGMTAEAFLKAKKLETAVA